MKLVVPVLFAVLAAACSGKAKPTTPANNGPADPPPLGPPPIMLGSTAFPELDWGAGSHELDIKYPGAEHDGDNVVTSGEYEGLPARFTFHLSDTVLDGITIDFTGEFASMPACGETWSKVRAAVDKEFGIASSSDNLAAYWETPGASVELACNPLGDGDPAGLSMRFSPHEME